MNDSSPPPALWKVWTWKLHWQIIFSLLLGAVFGIVWANVLVQTRGDAQADPPTTYAVASFILDLTKLVGDLFLNGLKLIVVPLVVSSLILSIAGLGSEDGGTFGRMAGRTLTYYMATSLIAIIIGLVLVNALRPGDVGGDQPLLDQGKGEALGASLSNEAELAASKQGGSITDILSVFRNLIPANPIQAAAETNLLGLITLATIIGVFIPKLPSNLAKLMLDFWQAVNDLTMLVTNFILRFAPIGVGCLLAATLADQGSRFLGMGQSEEFVSLLQAIGWFALTAALALAIHLFVVMPIILAGVARVNPLSHYKAMLPAMLTAFSTSSSNSTLPVTMECIEERVGVSRRTASFVLPLGATINMDGTALYECVAAIFIVQLFGVDLSFSEQFFIVMVALLTSIGVAGVPSASLVAIVIILQALEGQLRARGIDVPLELGLPLILVFDRLLDMGRTTVNIFSDSCGTVVVAKSMGETDLYR